MVVDTIRTDICSNACIILSTLLMRQPFIRYRKYNHAIEILRIADVRCGRRLCTALVAAKMSKRS